jgi:predicted metal-dependent phosphoesterase TrpH
MTIVPVMQESRSDLRSVFSAISADSCPHTYNFHLHTVCSDGRLEPERLIEQAIARGLTGLAITDHHSVKGYRLAQQWLNGWQQQHPDQSIPILWSGVEISADLAGGEVHILGYGFDPNHTALFPYLLGYTPIDEDYPAGQVIWAIHQAGGLAVLAHPARYRRSPAALVAMAADLGIDGVETYYCYNNPKVWQPSSDTAKEIGALAQSYNLLETCGTDTHGSDIFQRL